MDPLKTEKQARAYAANIAAITGEAQLVFKVREGTAAWQHGFRFGTCPASEREFFKHAVIVGEEVAP
jgi:hypothetical protein